MPSATFAGSGTVVISRLQPTRVLVSLAERSAGTAGRVFTALCERPIASIGEMAGRLGVSLPSVTRAMEALLGLGVISEITGRRRNRVYAYDEYLSTLTRDPGLDR